MWRTSVVFGIAAVLVAGLGTALHDSGPRVLASSEDRIELDGARWSIVEAHAPGDGTFQAAANLTVTIPPDDIRSVFGFFDAEWDPQGWYFWGVHTTGEASVVRADANEGEEHRAQAPSVEDLGNRSRPEATQSVGWSVSGDPDDSLVGYIVVLTQDDHPRLNITAMEDGWLGAHTEGTDVDHVRTRDFDSVDFHGKIGEEGPSLTVNAVEERAYQGSMIGAVHLAPGGGDAGWMGPDGAVGACQDRDDECKDLGLVEGPSGAYDFFINRHEQVYGDEPWILTADADRP
jgi:hypothetical protein